MSKETQAIRILVTLYRLASRGRIATEGALAEATRLEQPALSSLLTELEREGTLEREPLRLTLLGLGIAVAACKRSRSAGLRAAA